MNALNWQNLAVAIIVSAAVIYLCVRTVTLFVRRKRAGCGAGCDSCPSSANAEPRPLNDVVSIEQFTASAEQLGPKR
jgi:hypothetical protein